MKKLRIAVILALLLGLVVVAGVAAQGSIVRYDDTAGLNEFKDWDEVGESSLICNGNFDAEYWVEGEEGDFPLCWWTWERPKAGWESWHLSQVNMATIGDTAAEIPMDDAMGIFVRNIGGSGPYYAGAANRLDQVVVSDYYWVEVQATMWGEFPQIQFNNGLIVFKNGLVANSVAWYGLGTSEDPDTVSEWRELFVSSYHYGEPGAVPCANEWEECIQVGRYETIWIDGSDSGETPWLHVQAGHKFSTFNVWTVFTFDNILVRGLVEDSEDLSGWWDVGDTGWDKDAAR